MWQLKSVAGFQAKSANFEDEKDLANWWSDAGGFKIEMKKLKIAIQNTQLCLSLCAQTGRAPEELRFARHCRQRAIGR